MPLRVPVASPPVRWTVVVGCAGLILVASVLDPGPGPAPTVFGVDASVSLHLIAYAGLTGAVGYARLRADRRSLVIAAGTAVCFGIGVELLQAPLPYRTASLLDVLFNTIGAAVGSVLWRAVTPAVDPPSGSDGTTSI